MSAAKPGGETADSGELQAARRLAAENRLAEAEQAYARVLVREPEQREAMHFLGMCALQRGDSAQASALLERAAALAPQDPVILKDAGVGFLSAGRLEPAVAALRRALELAPQMFAAQLYLANAFERMGQEAEALKGYFRAVTAAQLAGRWLGDDTTPAALRENVTYAMRYIDQGRRRLFSGVLDPVRARHGSEVLRRVERGLAMYLGDIPRQPDDPLQRPKYLFVPGLPAQRFFEAAQLPYLRELEKEFDAIRAEACAVLADGDGREPFLRFPSAAHVDAYLQGSRGPPAWDAFFFYRHGERYEANCRRCPRTAAALEALPLVRVPEHAPEICFSILTPGTHILPHHGVTNTRLVAHLPLIVPEDCELKVGGEARAWHEGRCMVFDDTFEHEAWNRSGEVRVVLILDVWNPHLEEIERAAVTQLVAAIGEFNRETRAAGSS